MELINEIKKDINIDLKLPEMLDNALDIGLRAILPDFIEEDVIEIKNAFIQEGFIAGIEQIVKKIEDIINSIKSLFKGEFEDVDQIKKLVQKNGILSAGSSLIDTISKQLLDKKIISKKIYNMIKTGKNEILKALESELLKYYKEDENSLEKLKEDCQEWKENYTNKDYSKMKETMNKISKKIEQNKLIENIIKEARNIEKIEKYIEKSGSIENLSDNQKKFIENLTI